MDSNSLFAFLVAETENIEDALDAAKNNASDITIARLQGRLTELSIISDFFISETKKDLSKC